MNVNATITNKGISFKNYLSLFTSIYVLRPKYDDHKDSVPSIKFTLHV